jgi:hypothetical protein
LHHEWKEETANTKDGGREGRKSRDNLLYKSHPNTGSENLAAGVGTLTQVGRLVVEPGVSMGSNITNKMCKADFL